MKFIAKTANGWLAELSEADIAALLGETWFNSVSRDTLSAIGAVRGYGGHADFIGCTLPVAERFRRVTDVEAQHKRLAETAKNLHALADLLAAIGEPPLIPATPPADASSNS